MTQILYIGSKVVLLNGVQQRPVFGVCLVIDIQQFSAIGGRVNIRGNDQTHQYRDAEFIFHRAPCNCNRKFDTGWDFQRAALTRNASTLLSTSQSDHAILAGKKYDWPPVERVVTLAAA